MWKTIKEKQKPDDAQHHRACFYTLGYNELQRLQDVF